MNRVAVSAEEAPPPAWGGRLRRYARKVLARLGRDKWELSVFLCGDKAISELNSRYRGRAEPTDVLSFSLGEGPAFPRAGKPRGDIVISLDSLRENAGRFGVSEDEELRRVLIHGILHLDGMDHFSNESGEPMLQLQEQVLAELGGERILGRGV